MNNQQNQPAQQSLSQQISQSFSMLNAVAQFLSMIGDVFMRWPGSWGSRHAGFHMVVSWLVLFFFGPLLFPRENPTPLWWVWVAATAMLLLHRIAGLWRMWRGARVHSLYTGRSIFSLFTNSEATAKTLLEPTVWFLLSALARTFSPPMSAWMLTVAVSGFIANAYMAQAERARVQGAEDAWHDARIMQQELEKRMGQ